MKSKTGNSALLRRAVANALVAVGLKEAEIVFSSTRIEVPSYGIVISPALNDGKRVWKAEGSYSMMRLDDAFENEVTVLYFTVPLEDDVMLARRLATHIALTRIDAAIDAAVSGDGSMQR